MEFGYENLEVWQKSVSFAVEVINAIEDIDFPQKHFRLVEQTEASVTSVASNIKELKSQKCLWD